MPKTFIQLIWVAISTVPNLNYVKHLRELLLVVGVMFLIRCSHAASLPHPHIILSRHSCRKQRSDRETTRASRDGALVAGFALFQPLRIAALQATNALTKG